MLCIGRCCSRWWLCSEWCWLRRSLALGLHKGAVKFDQLFMVHGLLLHVLDRHHLKTHSHQLLFQHICEWVSAMSLVVTAPLSK